MLKKLYVGFCGLVTYKDELQVAQMPITSHDCPLGAGQCRARFNLLWKEGHEDVKLPSVDVLGHLRAFAKYLRQW